MFFRTISDACSPRSFLITYLLFIGNVCSSAVFSETLSLGFTGYDLNSPQPEQPLSSIRSRPPSGPSGPFPNPHGRRFPIGIPLRESWWLVVEDMIPFTPDTDVVRTMRSVYSQIQFQTVWHLEYSHPLPLVILNVGRVKLEFSSPAPLPLSWLQDIFAPTMMRLAARGLSGEYRVTFENQMTGVIVKVVLSVGDLVGLWLNIDMFENLEFGHGSKVNLKDMISIPRRWLFNRVLMFDT